MTLDSGTINAIIAITGLITAFATLAYFVATIFILISNNKMVKEASKQVETANKQLEIATEQNNLANKQLEEMQRQFDMMNRPYVVFGIEDIRNCVTCLSIENCGNLPADRINVSINDRFIENIPDKRLKENLIKTFEDTFYLTPKQKIYLALASPSEFKTISQEVMIISHSYQYLDKLYTEPPINIYLERYSRILIYNSPLTDIAQHIEKISDNISHNITGTPNND